MLLRLRVALYICTYNMLHKLALLQLPNSFCRISGFDREGSGSLLSGASLLETASGKSRWAAGSSKSEVSDITEATSGGGRSTSFSVTTLAQIRCQVLVEQDYQVLSRQPDSEILEAVHLLSVNHWLKQFRQWNSHNPSPKSSTYADDSTACPSRDGIDLEAVMHNPRMV